MTVGPSALVQGVQPLAVNPLDDVAADLDRGGELLILDRERLVGDDEAADLLDHRKVRIDPVDRGAERLDVIGIVGELAEIAFAPFAHQSAVHSGSGTIRPTM